MFTSVKRTALALVGASMLAGAGVAAAAGGPPPPPTPTHGGTVKIVAGGMGTPTSFAFGGGSVFEGDGGNSQTVPNGGVYVLKAGTATKLPGSPQFVSGLAWHQNALYIAGGFLSPTGASFRIVKWSGWNGTAFAHAATLYTAPKGFQGFNGLAFGPNGRLYVGVDVGLLNNNDHSPAKTPYVYDILTMTAAGKGLHVYATGIRQPWQMVFTKGSKNPLVSDLGQDKGVKNPPDFLLRVAKGDNYGFPQCSHTAKSKCKGFAKPFKLFPPHTDVMGLAVIGKTLYMTSFIGNGGKAGEVLSMPLKGGKVRVVLKGHVAPIVGLGVRGKTLYVGELTGIVYAFTP